MARWLWMSSVLALALIQQCSSFYFTIGTTNSRMNALVHRPTARARGIWRNYARHTPGGIIRRRIAMEEEQQTRSSKQRIQSEQILEWAPTRATETLEQTRSFSEVSSDYTPPQEQKNKHLDKRTYKNQPTVTPTALAHMLWKSVLRPGVDSAIDATCGSGHDALAIARMLFDDQAAGSSSALLKRGQLLCLDIQDVAVDRTKALFVENFDGSDILKENQVQVVQTSHALLPTHLLSSSDSVGLVCYNLGWLPGMPRTSELDQRLVSTQLDSTLESLADAALVLRVGGLLSVMTYPGTCAKEADAVREFCVALAMFTTRQEGGWRQGVNNLSDEIRDHVMEAAQRVYERGDPGQTWRVFDHRPLGRPLSPILVTATRIK